MLPVPWSDALPRWLEAQSCCLLPGSYVHLMVDRQADTTAVVEALLTGLQPPERPADGSPGSWWLLLPPGPQVANPLRPTASGARFRRTTGRAHADPDLPAQRRLDQTEFATYRQELAAALGTEAAWEFLLAGPSVYWQHWAGVKGSDPRRFGRALTLLSGSHLNARAHADALVLRGSPSAGSHAHEVGCATCSPGPATGLVIVVDDIVRGAARFTRSRHESRCPVHRGADWHIAAAECAATRAPADWWDEDEA